LKANKCKHKPSEWKTYEFPLSEIVVCGECGKPLGGKSARGNGGKAHYYYAHSRQLKTDGVNHAKRCRLERVRAPRVEEIVLKSLQTVLSRPEKFNGMIEAYQKKTVSEVPGLEGRLKTLDADIRTAERRVENLVARLADLPPEVSAEPVYRQMREFQGKIAEMKTAKATLGAKVSQASAKELDEEALRARLTSAVAQLMAASAGQTRPIISNVLKFAEMHPEKVRLGLWAPLKTANGEAAKDGGFSAAFGGASAAFCLDGFNNVGSSTSVWNGG
jgi:uncharacterized protein YoxC